MGEGERFVLMIITLSNHMNVPPPPIVIFNWDAPKGVLREGTGGGQMHKRTTPKTFARATPALAGGAREELHRNMTPAEVKLWARLRAHRLEGIHFRNQHAIGKYIVDICAPRKKLIIELDGGQHIDQQEYDEERTAYLKSKGYKVLRLWNNDVLKDIEGTIRAIINEMESKSHS